MLRALVGSRDFQRAVGTKVRDPGEDLVATYRALGVRISAAAGRLEGRAVRRQPDALAGRRHGRDALRLAAPDGQPIDNLSWASPARLIASMPVHRSMAGGWWPTDGAHYRKPAAWLPRKTVRFDALVDSMSQRILHRRATRGCSRRAARRPGASRTSGSPPTTAS